MASADGSIPSLSTSLPILNNQVNTASTVGREGSRASSTFVVILPSATGSTRMSRTGFAHPPAPGTFLPQVTSQFVQQFYTVLHQSPKQLHRFYADSSIFSVANVAGDGLVHTAVGQRVGGRAMGVLDCRMSGCM